MGGSYESYLALLRELSGSLEQLAQLAQDKAAAVRRDDLIGLDQVLKQEQAMGLNLRGTEQRRQKLAAQLDLGSTPLNDLPRHFPPELEIQAGQTVEQLRQSYAIYRGCADMARNLLELNLHQIERTITAAGVDPAKPGAGYEPPGVEPPQNMKTDFRA